MLSMFIAAAEGSADSIEKSARFFGTLMQRGSAWFKLQKENLIVAGLIAAAALCIAILLWCVLAMIASRLAAKSSLSSKILARLKAPLALVAAFVGLSVANQAVDLPGRSDLYLDKFFYAMYIIAFVWGALRVVGACDDHFAAKRKAEADAGMKRLVADLIRRAVKTVVWIVALIFVVQNIFKFNVTALLTGAGVVGLAIAFAAQNTIANIFGALSIVSDEIFKIGDVIDIGGKRGSVEAVGFRSTKLRSLDGTLWNLPTRLVADAAIENISSRKNIKFPFTLSLVYSTTKEQMQQALDILKEIFDAFPGFDHENNPPRYSFTAFNSSSLDIGVIVWFDTRNFFEAQAMKEKLNLTILERFTAAGLSFAYPSVTNYIVEKK